MKSGGLTASFHCYRYACDGPLQFEKQSQGYSRNLTSYFRVGPGLAQHVYDHYSCICKVCLCIDKVTYSGVQMDINGDAFGLLAAHPLTPLVSIHHLDVIKPIFPNYTRGAALEHLGKAAKVESASVLQQSICYSQRQEWSFSISWGLVVQVYKGFESPRVLETPIRTFHSCRRKFDKSEFPFNTRENPSDLCQQPSLYYMESTKGPSAATKGLLEGVYLKEDNWKKRRYCEKRLEPLTSVKRIRVLKEPVKESWFQVRSEFREC